MNPPLPPEREGSTPRSGAGEGLSEVGSDKAYDRLSTTRSRALRNNPTNAERQLWNALSNQQLGVRFNRQVVIRPYICDFVARSRKLVIEVDGGQHAVEAGRDEARTRFLISKGYRVVRFWNNDVLENIEGVVTTIMQAIENMPSRSGGRGPNPNPAGAGGVDSPQVSGGGPVLSEDDRPSPSGLRPSSPPAPAGGGK